MITSNNKNLTKILREKVSELPELPHNILWKNITYAYYLRLLTRPFIFSICLYPILIILSLFNLDIINFYNKTFKRSIFLGNKMYKLSNLQALIGDNMLRSYKSLFIQRIEKTRVFVKSCKENCLKFDDHRDIKGENIFFPYFFIIKSHNSEQLSKRLLWAGVDSGKQLMSNCGKLFLGSSDFINAENAYSHSIQIPIERCTKKQINTIVSIIKRQL